MEYEELETGTRNHIAQLEVDYQLTMNMLSKQTEGGKIMPDYALYQKAISINKELMIYKDQLKSLRKERQTLGF